MISSIVNEHDKKPSFYEFGKDDIELKNERNEV